MRFYVVSELRGTILGCELSLKAAKSILKALKVSGNIDRVDVEVTAESIRRLLGEIGGYAINEVRVYRK